MILLIKSYIVKKEKIIFKDLENSNLIFPSLLCRISEFLFYNEEIDIKYLYMR